MKRVKLKYYAIGEVVSIGRGLYVVRRSNRGIDRCADCALKFKKSCARMNCVKALRKDSEFVIFERV